MRSKAPFSLPLWSAFVVAALFLPAAGFAADREHTVRSGETVYSLAQRYGVKSEEILFLNSIQDARKITAGQKLRIPGSQIQVDPVGSPKSPLTTYSAQNGDTLYGIARKFGTTYQELVDINKYSKNKVLKIGEIVKVPARQAGTPVAAGTPLPGIPADRVAKPLSSGGAPAANSAARPAAQPAAGNLVNRAVDTQLRWPVKIREAAYMKGKLDGVVLTGEKSAPVQSISSGTVVSAGPYRGFGRVAIVQSDAGYIYVYGGCEALAVRAGERVAPGAELGKLGVDAVSQKPQLFFMVYNGTKAIDPAKAPRS